MPMEPVNAIALLRGAPRRLDDWIRAGFASRLWPALTLLILVFMVLAHASWRLAQSSEPGPFQASQSDFDDYRQASIRFYSGEDPYNLEQLERLHSPGGAMSEGRIVNLVEVMQSLRGLGTYLYPPFTAFLLGPLRGLDYSAAVLVYQALGMLALAFTGLVLLLGPQRSASVSKTETLRSVALCFALCAGLLAENANNGNIGAFLIALTAAGLILSFRAEASLAALGGMLIGLAICIKVTPVFLAIVLFAGRRIAALIGLGLGLFVGFLSPALVVSWDSNLELLNLWRRYILKSFNEFVFIRSWANNQSIPGAIGKLFVPFSDPLQHQFGLPWLFSQAAPDAAQLGRLKWLARLLILALYALTALAGLVVSWRFWLQSMLLRRNAALPDGDPMARLFDPSMIRLVALCIFVSLVGAGVSWRHAYCALLPAALIALHHYRVIEQPLPWLERLWIGFVALFSHGFPLLPSLARSALAIYSVFLWLAAALCLLLAWSLLKEGREQHGL